MVSNLSFKLVEDGITLLDRQSATDSNLSIAPMGGLTGASVIPVYPQPDRSGPPATLDWVLRLTLTVLGLGGGGVIAVSILAGAVPFGGRRN